MAKEWRKCEEGELHCGAKRKHQSETPTIDTDTDGRKMLQSLKSLCAKCVQNCRQDTVVLNTPSGRFGNVGLVPATSAQQHGNENQHGAETANIN